LWAEAYGESVRGKEAIAAVILNRLKAAQTHFGKDWWGNTIVEACLSGDQPGCWRETPERRQRLLQTGPDDPVFRICYRIASRAIRGALIDPTYGATYYCRLGESPGWMSHCTPTIILGDRKFYRILEPVDALG
jgi:hypothetical protein